jgi:hypothetical protein
MMHSQKNIKKGDFMFFVQCIVIQLCVVNQQS